MYLDKKTAKRAQEGTPIKRALFSDVRQQSHETRALHGGRYLAMVLGADVRVARVNDLCLARNEPLQKIGFLKVNVLQILGTEKALLGHRTKLKLKNKKVKIKVFRKRNSIIFHFEIYILHRIVP
jgi:hypothetical protein